MTESREECIKECNELFRIYSRQMDICRVYIKMYNTQANEYKYIGTENAAYDNSVKLRKGYINKYDEHMRIANYLRFSCMKKFGLIEEIDYNRDMEILTDAYEKEKNHLHHLCTKLNCMEYYDEEVNIVEESINDIEYSRKCYLEEYFDFYENPITDEMGFPVFRYGIFSTDKCTYMPSRGQFFKLYNNIVLPDTPLHSHVASRDEKLENLYISLMKDHIAFDINGILFRIRETICVLQQKLESKKKRPIETTEDDQNSIKKTRV